ncbi:hypothetical protein BD780_000756 [Clostridium tetanomorphum]|uniref:AAA family ATPase n=1 Tax=Clostridium tetanomorphum TaxID=1553 RepID=A0A923E6X1_CLOTT|nr:ATP-binding protein [Clostridium tetanomorphum]KAJ50970.1 hypothetical protein CTM_15143 [Clostridium tetanomorphum DSM 665]MBC2396337.1 AAA family ATPase [Clostridium tetanomorphum]MBP1863434.1 hypothetical protein [Clostridium tetanomorphum]NRS83531.1 hypothetical protein [Clostridium tetanomorphum]NRZ96731.1 hypothetical protein [Clostridium tetanomorphum]
MKRIPYGISNFEVLREKNYIYVDKTSYIEILDIYAPYQFFIRPRRFGKSLFLSMMESYYDINSKDKFAKLFGELYIGKNPTEERNKYVVWKISFAGVDSGHGEEKLRKSFNQKVRLSAQDFVNRYCNLLKEINIPEEINSAEIIVEYIKMITKTNNLKVFVLIDEYDNFANELITGGNQNTYHGILHGEGFVKSFYKALKDATADNFERIFMTGVSPIMLDDLTSGFNITRNYTLDRRVNSMLGFTEEELLNIMKELGINDEKNKNTLFKDMRDYYNGYRFNEKSETVFNPDMTMYFLDEYLAYNEYPKEMIDNNVRTDYGRINRIAMNFKDETIIDDIMSKGEVKTRLVEKFNLSTMYDNKENFKSLLFYLGMLTIKSVEASYITLGIPNYVIKNIYWEEFYEIINKNVSIDNSKIFYSISEMRNGNIASLIVELKTILRELSNRDLMKFDEKYIKMILLTLFAIDDTYIIQSEYENNNGYADIYLRTKIQFKQCTKYEWLIELKYIKEGEKSSLEKVKEQGLKQIERYKTSKIVSQNVNKNRIKTALIIVVGKNEVYVF